MKLLFPNNSSNLIKCFFYSFFDRICFVFTSIDAVGCILIILNKLINILFHISNGLLKLFLYHMICFFNDFHVMLVMLAWIVKTNTCDDTLGTKTMYFTSKTIVHDWLLFMSLTISIIFTSVVIAWSWIIADSVTMLCLMGYWLYLWFRLFSYLYLFLLFYRLFAWNLGSACVFTLYFLVYFYLLAVVLRPSFINRSLHFLLLILINFHIVHFLHIMLILPNLLYFANAFLIKISFCLAFFALNEQSPDYGFNRVLMIKSLYCALRTQIMIAVHHQYVIWNWWAFWTIY